MEEAKEKVAFRRQVRAWFLGGQRPVVRELEPDLSMNFPTGREDDEPGREQEVHQRAQGSGTKRKGSHLEQRS